MNFKYKELIDFLNSHLKTLEIYIVSNLGYGNSDKRKEEFKKSRIGNPDLYFLPVNQLNDPYKIGKICVEQEAFHIIPPLALALDIRSYTRKAGVAQRQ